MTDSFTEISIRDCVDEAVEYAASESSWRGHTMSDRLKHNLKAILTKRVMNGLEHQDMAYMTELQDEVEELRQKQEHVEAPRAELIEEHRRMRNLVKAIMYKTGHSEEPLAVPFDFDDRYRDVELSFTETGDGDAIRITTREDVEPSDMR